MAQNEYEFSMRRATGLKKTGHAVLRHVDGALRGLERVACVPRRQLAISHADNKYEFSTPSRRLESEVRKRAKPYCGTSTAHCEGWNAWPACLGGNSL